MKERTLKVILDRLYRDYNFRDRIRYDPIEFPHRYDSPHDIEIAGFIASCLAYGKVSLFRPVIEKILARMGRSPYDFLMHFTLYRHRKLFGGIQYRFNRNEDIICLIFLLHLLLKKHQSIENAFMRACGSDGAVVEKGLSGLIASFLTIHTTRIYGTNIKPAGLMQFFPSPSHGSACKRMNLFLRWMVRDRDIDFGIWRGIPMNSLIIPLDTHIARIARCLGFTQRTSADWKTAVEITESLKTFDPDDPLKYDFALCHHGISGLCTALDRSRCSRCVFHRFARAPLKTFRARVT